MSERRTRVFTASPRFTPLSHTVLDSWPTRLPFSAFTRPQGEQDDCSALASFSWTRISSFAIVHALADETLTTLFDKLTRKADAEYLGARVGSGWLKYEWKGTTWNLDDGQCFSPMLTLKADSNTPLEDGDYTILKMRHSPATTSGTPVENTESLELFLHNPTSPLPTPPAYCNPSYYAFRTSAVPMNPTATASSRKSTKAQSVRTRKTSRGHVDGVDMSIPKHKLEFDRARANGVRTVIGTIGQVPNVRMLLKSDHRHVYVARKFAILHGLVPKEASPGQFGYTGLVQ
jgi:hypothetical protein